MAVAVFWLGGVAWQQAGVDWQPVSVEPELLHELLHELFRFDSQQGLADSQHAAPVTLIFEMGRTGSGRAQHPPPEAGQISLDGQHSGSS